MLFECVFCFNEYKTNNYMVMKMGFRRKASALCFHVQYESVLAIPMLFHNFGFLGDLGSSILLVAKRSEGL